MGVVKNTLLTVGLISGGMYAVGEHFGPGDCAEGVFSKDTSEIAAACTGIDLRQQADATVTGPKTLVQEVISSELHMTFDEIALQLVFPVDEKTGKKTRLEWDPGGIKSCIGACAVINVEPEPFEVRTTICAKLADDYRDVEVGIDANNPDQESTFEMTIDHSKQTIFLKAGALAACSVLIPKIDSQGRPNQIRFTNKDESIISLGTNDVNNGVEGTFRYAVEDIAESSIPAVLCTEELVDEVAIKKQIEYYGKGQAVTLDPTTANYAVDVELGNQAEAKAFAVKNYQDKVNKYIQLERSIFPDTKGEYKEMDIRISQTAAQLASSDCSGTVINTQP